MQQARRPLAAHLRTRTSHDDLRFFTPWIDGSRVAAGLGSGHEDRLELRELVLSAQHRVLHDRRGGPAERASSIADATDAVGDCIVVLKRSCAGSVPVPCQRAGSGPNDTI